MAEAEREPEPVGDVMERGARQPQTNPWGSAVSEGVQNGREITPGDEETSSDYMARMIFKARAEELTLALAKLESENDPNVFVGEEPAVEKPIASKGEVAAKPEDDSETKTSPEAQEQTVQQGLDLPVREEISDLPVKAENLDLPVKEESLVLPSEESKPEDGHVAAPPIPEQSDPSAASAVADKEVDPNSLSLGEAHIGENKVGLDSQIWVGANEDCCSYEVLYYVGVVHGFVLTALAGQRGDCY